MLSRTADSLYWVSRYIERAEYIARIIDAATRLSRLPTIYTRDQNVWLSCVESAGSRGEFTRLHGTATEQSVKRYLAFDSDNASSIRSCIELARQNARAVRTALTSEMWEAINGAWLELKKFDGAKMSREEFDRFLEWVKQISLAYDGSAYRNMLRSDAYWFSRLGVYLERADNTARILDVKYHVLLPAVEPVGGSLDYFQWTTMLREVSAQTSYHWVYRQSVKPWLVADLLILQRQMPRSLASCYENMTRFLDSIGEAYGRQGPSQRMARKMMKQLAETNIDAIYAAGLHEFIEQFLADNNALGATVAEQYLV
jgi:uncharacterized alpha-E superfamily protein